MAQDHLQLEVYKQHRTAQEKYIYFLLAAAGAAIALVVNQTQGLPLRLSQAPLGLAVMLWGLSFYFGCRHLTYVELTLFHNAELLKVQSGEHPNVGNRPDLAMIANEVIREVIERDGRRSHRFARLQFASLIVGAILFLGWHVFEMWLRANV